MTFFTKLQPRKTLKTADFHFDLPNELIAQYPLKNRTDSRLLALRKDGTNEHRHFKDIIDYLNPGDLLIFNNSRVMNARFHGNKPSGGKVEILIERIVEDGVLAHVKASKALKPGTRAIITEGIEFEMIERVGDLFKLALIAEDSIWDVMKTHGHVPLPPYIERSDEKSDLERYQTVYAKPEGSVAAPTAGLHFDTNLLEQIKAKGINTAEVTLHVGAGTFQPVRVDDVLNHHMHSEYIEVPQDVCDKINQTKAAGNRVIAVGTTSVRSLESASTSGTITPFYGDTDIFIYPGYTFKTVDAIITNFHLPESTLIMLVSALAGKKRILDAYAEAVENKYRFFSYGDGMFIEGLET